MKLNHLEDFKSKISAGKICQGLVVQLADPVVGELAGEAGFDFTWIDAEHCPHTLQKKPRRLFRLTPAGTFEEGSFSMSENTLKTQWTLQPGEVGIYRIGFAS